MLYNREQTTIKRLSLEYTLAQISRLTRKDQLLWPLSGKIPSETLSIFKIVVIDQSYFYQRSGYLVSIVVAKTLYS